MNGSSYTNNTSKNKLVVPGAQNAVDQMKYEIANEFGVNLGPDATARQNGSVGGEMVRKMIKRQEEQMSSGSNL